MNKKGFTMVELLGAIVILGILSTLGMITFTRYRDRSAVKAYDLMHEGAATAAENYFLEAQGEESITIAELYEMDFLDKPQDPWNRDGVCIGEVKRIEESKQQGDALASYNYEVQIKCSQGCKCKIYPSKNSCTCDAKYR